MSANTAPSAHTKRNDETIQKIARDVGEMKDTLKAHCAKEDENGIAIAGIKDTMLTKDEFTLAKEEIINAINRRAM